MHGRKRGIGLVHYCKIQSGLWQFLPAKRVVGNVDGDSGGGRSLNKQAPGSISLLPGCVLIQVLLKAGQAAVAADLSDLPQAQPCLVGSGVGRAAEAVGCHPFDGNLLSQWM